MSVRTIRRDIDTLRTLGFTAEVTRGADGPHALRSGRRLPPLVFDEQQAIAIALALPAAPRSIVGLEFAADRVLVTMIEVLPTRLRQQAAGLRITAVVNLWDLAAPPVPMDVLTAVSAAIDHHETLRYHLDGADTAPALSIEPHHLVSWSGRWCLLGWTPAEGGWRSVRLDRLGLRTPNGPRFVGRDVPGGDVAEFFVSLLDRGDTQDQWQCAGSATVAQPAAVVARYAPGGTRVESLGPTTCRVTMGAWSWNGIAALLGSSRSGHRRGAR